MKFDQVLKIPLLEKSSEKFDYRSHNMLENLTEKIEKKLTGKK